MNKKIKLETFRLLAFLDTLLRDDNGISEQAYRGLHILLGDSASDLSDELTKIVDATDGRFYLREDAPHLYELVV